MASPKLVSCPLCGEGIPADRLESHLSLEGDLIELVKQEHPEWVEADGLCPKCIEHIRVSMPGRWGWA